MGQDFIASELQFEPLPLRLGDMPHRRTIAVARVEDIALRVVVPDPGAGENVLAHPAHQSHVKMNVVQAKQLPPLCLGNAVQVIQIGNRIRRTGRAVASGIDRSLHRPVGGAPQVPPAHAGERHALFRQRGGQDAIEHVDAAMHGLEEVERRSHTHQIPRPLRRQELRHDRRAILPLTLHDAEQRLPRVATCHQAALRPAMGEVHGPLGDPMFHGGGDALIEDHHDVAADRTLCGDAALGAETDQGLIDVAAKLRALLRDRPAARE